MLINKKNQPKNGQVIFKATPVGVEAIEVWDFSGMPYRGFFYTLITEALTTAKILGWNGELSPQQQKAVRHFKKYKNL